MTLPQGIESASAGFILSLIGLRPKPWMARAEGSHGASGVLSSLGTFSVGRLTSVDLKANIAFPLRHKTNAGAVT